MIKSVAIPLDRVRLQIVTNPKKKDMRELWRIYGGENKILLNGPFFDFSTYKAGVHLKMDGNVLCKPNYGEWGFAWNKNEPPVWTVLPTDGYSNYVTNTVVIPKDGQPRSQLTSHLDADGTKAKPRYTSRPAWGLKDSRFMIYVNSGAVSLWGLQNILVDSKWSNAIVGDGGGSTAYKDSNTEIYTSRKIPYWLLVEVIDNEPKGDKPMNGAKIRAYSLSKDGDKKLSKNFTVREFACSDGSDPVFISDDLVALLQKIRDHYAKAVNINSSYRTPAKNKAVGGATYSQHLYGTAADFHIKGVTPKQIAAYVETLIPNTGGIGIYDSFIHVDVRGQRARWNG